MSESVSEKPWRVKEISYAEAEEIGLKNLPGNSQKYSHSSYSNFVVTHRNHGVIGKGDLYESSEYVIMEAAEIPHHRGLKYRNSSPFGDLIESRIESAEERNMRTLAVTEHGKTQYKYPQYNFNATGILPLQEPNSKPLVPMWNADFGERNVYVKDELEKFVEESTENLFKTRFRDAINLGEIRRDYDIRNSAPAGSPLNFSIRSGTRSPEDIASVIDTKSRIGENCITSVSMSLEDPATQVLTEEFYERGYRPLRVDMPDPSTNTPSHIVMGRIHAPIENLEMTEQTIELIEEAGLNFEVQEEGEKSSEVDLLEN